MATKNKKQKLQKLVIDRKKWARGGKGGDANLLNKSRKMCCLGFHAIQIGKLKPKDIREITTPEDINNISKCSDNFIGLINKSTYRQHDYRDTVTCDRLTVVNDDALLTDAEREKQIKAHFKSINIRVSFIN